MMKAADGAPREHVIDSGERRHGLASASSGQRESRSGGRVEAVMVLR
jgi:hypothetical protein